MVNWKNINTDFTPELQKEWEDRGFVYKQCKEWIDIGLKANDADYAKWLRDTKKMDAKWVLDNENSEQFRKEYENCLISRWSDKGFTDEEISAWNSVGLRFQDGGYAAWLRDIPKITPENYLEYLGEGNDDELLREQHQIFLEERKNKNKKTDDQDWIYCEQCKEKIRINRGEKGIFLCSENCYLIWQNQKEQFPSPQKWLEENYFDKESVKKIVFFSGKLEFSQIGELLIANYPNLEEIAAMGGEEDAKNIIKGVTKITILNCPRLKEINIGNFIDNQELNIIDCPNLEVLHCKNNQLTKLDMSNCLQLRILDCYGNKITKLDLTNCSQLKELMCRINQLTELNLTNLKELEFLACSENHLTQLNLSQNKQLIKITCRQNNLEQLILPKKLNNLRELSCWWNRLTSLDFLDNLNPEKLEIISLGDNDFPPQSLEIFTPFYKLKNLRVGGVIKPSYFTGSLKPLRRLEKLEIIDIKGTDISHGLEYLPDSVREVDCSPSMSSKAKIVDMYEELQSFGGDIKKWREARLEKRLDLVVSPLLPPQLTNKIKKRNKFQENYGIPNTNYEEMYFNLWKDRKNQQSLLIKGFPTRLYNIEKKEIEKTEGQKGKYAILSYVWGDPDMKANKEMLEKYELETKEKLNISGNKALYKAIRACKYLDINYLWIDQLCIKQGSSEESKKDKEQEIPKMRSYYSNATNTLISLNTELGNISDVDLIDILKLVVRSEWFTRSWTFQEGWLSKWTVFMFDDKLIDGRAMAGVWALNQLGYANEGRYLSRGEFERGTKKIATPVGWTYYRDGYDENDKVTMTLTQALKEIKNRKRSIPVDGIYSILGLLPYGEEAKVSYLMDNTPEKVLKEVMELAVEKGYAEPLAWHGESNQNPSLCWMPKIDEHGSTSIVGSVGKIFSIFKDADGSIRKPVIMDNRSIVFTYLMPHYIVHLDSQDIHRLEVGFEFEGGLYRKDITLRPKDTSEEIKVSLLGTKEVLKSVKENSILIVLYKEWFITNKLFALLVEANQDSVFYHRIGLVELINNEDIKFTIEVKKFHEKTVIGTNTLQSEIQIPPK